MFPAGAGQLSRGPPPFWVGWCFSGVFGVWVRLLQSSNSCWICSSRSCARVEPGQQEAAVNKLVDTKIKGRKPPILLVLNTIVSPYLPLFLILPWIITPVCFLVNRYFRPKAKNFSQKTAISYEGNHGSSRGRPVPKLVTYRIRRNVGFLLLEFGSFHETRCTGPVPNLSSVIYPQAVDNYGSLGVCGSRPAVLSQRAPGKLHRTTVL